MKFGKRRPDAEPVAEPTGVAAPPPPGPEPAARRSVVGYEPPAREADDGDGGEAEAIVDAEAVELPAAEAPAAGAAPPPPPAYVPPTPPFPVAEEPVAVVSSGPEPGGVTPLAESGPV